MSEASGHAGLDLDPQARILGEVQLEPPARVCAGAVLQGPLVAGPGLVAHPGALVGGPAQHRVRGEGQLVLGSGVEIWEAATIHRGSSVGEGTTRIGNDVMIMAYAHVGHDVVLGDGVVLSNGAQLGGHVQADQGAVFGARCAVHQFVRVGRGAMIAAGAMVSGDVPPWTLVAGDRARIVGPNRVGIDDDQATRAMKRALRLLFPRQVEPEELRLELGHHRPVADLLDFLAVPSRRALCRRLGNS